MIGKLTGTVDEVLEEYFLLDVNGVGYMVLCSAKTLSRHNIGDNISLYIETHVREDYIRLYGFHSLEEKEIFNIMQSVKGVSAKISLSILSVLSINDIQLALSSKDATIFQSTNGVGKKLAERIITELKDKILTKNNITINNNKNTENNINITNDAVSALIGLGINKADAQTRVNNIIANTPEISINELIRLSLKNT